MRVPLNLSISANKWRSCRKRSLFCKPRWIIKGSAQWQLLISQTERSRHCISWRKGTHQLGRKRVHPRALKKKLELDSDQAFGFYYSPIHWSYWKQNMLNEPMRNQSAKRRPHKVLNNLNSSTKNFQMKKMEVMYTVKVKWYRINHNVWALFGPWLKLQRKNDRIIGNIWKLTLYYLII